MKHPFFLPKSESNAIRCPKQTTDKNCDFQLSFLKSIPEWFLTILNFFNILKWSEKCNFISNSSKHHLLMGYNIHFLKIRFAPTPFLTLSVCTAQSIQFLAMKEKAKGEEMRND